MKQCLALIFDAHAFGNGFWFQTWHFVTHTYRSRCTIRSIVGKGSRHWFYSALHPGLFPDSKFCDIMTYLFRNTAFNLQTTGDFVMWTYVDSWFLQGLGVSFENSDEALNFFQQSGGTWTLDQNVTVKKWPFLARLWGKTEQPTKIYVRPRQKVGNFFGVFLVKKS